MKKLMFIGSILMGTKPITQMIVVSIDDGIGSWYMDPKQYHASRTAMVGLALQIKIHNTQINKYTNSQILSQQNNISTSTQIYKDTNIQSSTSTENYQESFYLKHCV